MYRSGAIEHCLFRFLVCLRQKLFFWLASWTSNLLAAGITPKTTAGFSKSLPAFQRHLLGGRYVFEDPFTEGCDGVNYQTLPPRRSNKLHF